VKAAAGRQRWALSFADLCLLLLGFFVLLQAKPDANHLSAGLRAAFGAREAAALERPAAALFEPGEAILTNEGRATLAAFARSALGGGLVVASRGSEAEAARFDGWELSAARTAAVARFLAGSGIAQDKIALAIDPATGGGQTIRISRD
jgi:hypothetical protein